MKRHISPLSRHLSDAYKDVRGVKVTTKGGKYALHRPCCLLYTDAILAVYRDCFEFIKVFVALVTTPCYNNKACGSGQDSGTTEKHVNLPFLYMVYGAMCSATWIPFGKVTVLMGVFFSSFGRFPPCRHNETPMSLDGDTTTSKSRLLRAKHSRNRHPRSWVRAIALLVHTGWPVRHRNEYAS